MLNINTFNSSKGILIILISFLCSFTMNGKAISVQNLTCDYKSNPILVSTTSPEFGWQFRSEQSDVQQTAYAIELFSIEKGKEKKIWKSGKIKSNLSQQLKYNGKAPLNPGRLYKWRVRVWNNRNQKSAWSEMNSFRIAPSDIESNAQWIGAIDKKDSNIPEGRNYHGLSVTSEAGKKWEKTEPLSKKSIYLRKDFPVKKDVEDAIIYISGLGHYELTLNGEKMGDSEFAPMWSDYDKTVYYNAYDVTKDLTKDNTIGVLLGNGFFNEQGGRYKKLQVSFGPPTLFFKMIITYKDGTKHEIVSDKNWKYALSPITYNDMYGGESYDARLEQDGWDKSGFDDSNWNKVIVQESPKGKLRPQTADPIKIMETFDVKSSKKVGNSYVFDMGQNLSGFPKIKVKGKKGDIIKLTVGENINNDGSVNQSQSGAPYYYEYTLKGGEEEIWHPRFSYYGYRYIQVDGAKPEVNNDNRNIPLLLNLKSCFVYNSVPQTGSFYCSNEIFNDAHRIIINAIKSNMQSVFTDCPHREKLGWLEEVHLNGPGLLYNFNLTSFAPKIMQDIRDAQLSNGLVPDIAPEYVIFDGGFRDSPEWASTAVIFPFMYYEFYGDNSLIVEYYDVMKKYVDYLSSTATNHIVSHGLGDWYDYNVNFPAGTSRNTPIPLSATMHYYMDIDYLVQAAEMLKKDEDISFYRDLREKVKAAYNKEFFNKDTKQYGTGSQASNAMSLFINVVPQEYKQDVLNNLIEDIKNHGYKLTTGDVGNRYLYQVLSENGLDEIMYKMHNHKEVPGYGFQIQFGATTLTEQWDPRNGNSWNHFMMGQIEEWFYKSLAGINVDDTSNIGFQNIVIAPKPVGDLKFVEAHYNSLYGKINVDWKIENEKFTMNISIPENCKAKVYLPGEELFKEVGSGAYSFSKNINR
ncbi:MAG: glycoside hydrolase family 78 protein [Dysgonamonadaceae bacterium]|nr:glycoside hydrolase family 78 protein [Dysgonamonadaceae bacterium]